MPIEVAPAIDRPMFQLQRASCVLDRGFMRNALGGPGRRRHHPLVFTVDMPTPGAATATPIPAWAAPTPPAPVLQAMTHPAWTWDVSLLGKPHDLGNISHLPWQPHRPGGLYRLAGGQFDPVDFLEGPGVDPRFLGRPNGDQGHPRPGTPATR